MQPLQLPPIAIIGMAGVFPQAANLREYWQNILHKIDCITDVPETRWKIDDYYDPDPTAPDKTYCKRGGFLPDIDFDPLAFGLPPNILEVTDVSQLLALVVAQQAMADAGYDEQAEFDRERTGVILGVTSGQKMLTPLTSRLQYPIWERVLKSYGLPDEDIERVTERMKLAYIEWQENAFPGLLGNVVAGRITNRLNLGGTNCVVDAACASSLGALKMALSELTEHRCDMVLTGGVDTDNSVFMYMCFSKTPAFSRGDYPRPFDAAADGMMVGEGLGMMVLKRLDDAERDGDRIYAVIRGIGTASDGRNKSIYAPHAAGQARALEAAYANAGIEPRTVSLIESHGTGTVAGDLTEFTSLRHVFGDSGAAQQSIALGSVKSQIGHTKSTAGAASLIKVALALHHKVLPATLHVDEPNPKFAIEESPFYINTETRPWVRGQEAPPRRAGVSSFGFGGTNFHVVLEEYSADHQQPYRLHQDARPVVLDAPTPAALREQCTSMLAGLTGDAAAATFATLLAPPAAPQIPPAHARVGFVAATPDEARAALQVCADMLERRADADEWQHPKGIVYRRSGMDVQGRVVALFSGQGSQYVEMGRELALSQPTLRRALGYMDSLFAAEEQPTLSARLFPPPAFSDEQRAAQTAALQRTDYAQPALGVLSSSMYKLLERAGFRPDFVAGHSFGELTALWAAGVLADGDYFALVRARGQAMAAQPGAAHDAGTMLAVSGTLDGLAEAIRPFAGVQIANYNSPHQVVLAGPTAAIKQAHTALSAQGYTCVALPVAAAFHTPLVAHAQQPFARAVAGATFHTPRVPVFANATAQSYPHDPAAIQQQLGQHMLEPVLFQRQIEALYDQGGRVFVEIGPRGVLTNLVRDTLGTRPYVALALNESRQKDSVRQFQQALMQLRVLGLPLDTADNLYLPLPASAAPAKRKGLRVQLSGSNYVSPQRRSVFEEALQSGGQLSVTHTNNGQASQRNGNSTASPPAPVSQPHTNGSANGNTNGSANGNTNGSANGMHKPNLPAALPAPSVLPVTHIAKKTEDKPEMSMQSPIPEALQQQVLASLEQSLQQFSSQQHETLRLHGQYLAQQTEFTQTFFAFLRQQQEALLRYSGSELPAGVAESLNQSAAMLRAHQAETLRVHEQYMQQQAEQGRQFFALVQQQYDALLGGQPAAVAAPAVPAAPAAPVPAVPAAPAAPAPVAQAAPAAPAPVAPAAPAAPAPVAQAAPAAPAPVAPAAPAVPAPAPTMAPPAFSFDDEPVPAVAVPAQAAPAAAPPPPPAPTPAPAPVAAAPAPAPAPVAQAAPAAPAAPGASSDELLNRLLAVVSEKTGYPVEMLEPEMEMEADLGIDSIKRVEILGTLQESFPELPTLQPEELAELQTLGQISARLAGSAPAAAPAAPAPAAPAPATPAPEAAPAAPAAPGASNDELLNRLLAVVSEKTGYPVEMLEPEMEMEADLGIDSIKRVEILGTLQESFPELPTLQPEELAELQTLGQISARLADSAAPAAASAQSYPRVGAIPAPPVQRMVAQLRALPLPDFRELRLPDGAVCLLTDDGSPLTAEVAAQLAARQWRVVVLRLPRTLVASPAALPAGVAEVPLSDMEEASLVAALQMIAQQHGSIAACVHLHPQTPAHEGLFSEAEKVIVRHVFLLAKHLKASLNTAAMQQWGAFMTVARLDGAFGLDQQQPFGAIGGGLFGLTKSLNLEWEPVYCRALDLSPTLTVAQAARCVLAELHDPNRLLAEVAYGAHGRVTLVGDEQ